MSKISRFEEKLEKRSNELTQAAIKLFRKEVAEAVEKLCASSGSHVHCSDMRTGTVLTIGSMGRSVLEPLLGADAASVNEWPMFLWRGTRDKLETEVLEKMDVVSKAMMSKGPDPEGPQPPKKGEEHV